MPSWKKVITSGSAAALSSLNVTGGITGSSILISGSTGTLFSSNVDTLVLTGSLLVTGSTVLSGSLNVSQGITGSLFGTASFATQALSASYAPSAGLTGGTANYIPLWTSTSAISSSAIYQSAGNVGIGTTSPAEKLSIAGNIELTVGVNRYVKIGSATNYFYNLQSVNDNFQILEAGTTPRLTITYPNGNVGIGTTSPNAKLDISGSLNISGSGVQVPLQVYSGSTPLLFVSQSGNVGIGTTSPFSRFTTLGALSTSTSQMSIVNSEGGHTILRTGISGLTNSGFSLISADVAGTNQNTRLVVSSTGNVGIGTTTPNAKLDISGSALITGSLNVTAGITGSLFGTASWAVSASWAPVATTAATASFVTASNVYGPFGSNSILSSSFAQTASFAPLYLPLTGGTITGNVTVNGTQLENRGPN